MTRRKNDQEIDTNGSATTKKRIKDEKKMKHATLQTSCETGRAMTGRNVESMVMNKHLPRQQEEQQLQE